MRVNRDGNAYYNQNNDFLAHLSAVLKVPAFSFPLPMKVLKTTFHRIDCVRAIVFGCLTIPTSGRPLGQSSDGHLRNANRRALNVSSATGSSFYSTSMTALTTLATAEPPSYGPSGMTFYMVDQD